LKHDVDNTVMFVMNCVYFIDAFSATYKNMFSVLHEPLVR